MGNALWLCEGRASRLTCSQTTNVKLKNNDEK